MSNYPGRNCFDIVQPFVVEAGAEGFDRFQLFGGVGSYALTLTTAEAHPDDRAITAREDMFLSQYRPDGNLRDFDGLILSTSQQYIASVEEIARETVGDELELSLFGLHKTSELRRQTEQPLKTSTRAFVSDRYAIERDGRIIIARKALFPFAVDMDPDSLETWHLHVPQGEPLPIPHPGTTIINYLTRSISGLRPKDKTKVEALTQNLATKMPSIKDWLMDGPGQSQLELARILHSLRHAGTHEGPLQVANWLSIKPYSLNELMEHEALIADGDDQLVQRLVKFASLKSRVVHFYEKHDKAVSWWQKHIEPKISAILKNKS